MKKNQVKTLIKNKNVKHQIYTIRISNISVNNSPYGLNYLMLLIQSLVVNNAIIQFKPFKKCCFSTSVPQRFTIISTHWDTFHRIRADLDDDV